MDRCWLPIDDELLKHRDLFLLLKVWLYSYRLLEDMVKKQQRTMPVAYRSLTSPGGYSEVDQVQDKGRLYVYVLIHAWLQACIDALDRVRACRMPHSLTCGYFLRHAYAGDNVCHDTTVISRSHHLSSKSVDLATPTICKLREGRLTGSNVNGRMASLPYIRRTSTTPESL